MRSCWQLLLGILSILPATEALAAPAIPTKPIYTNKQRFFIPYRYDAAEMKQLGAKEIRLYVSTKQGADWQQAAAVPPQKGKFEYQAPQDGEYWFAVRTLDGRNQIHPPGNIVEPGLRVIVDTSNPKIDVELEQTVPGKLRLSWSSSDIHLDASSLKLEFIQEGDNNWKQVSVIAQPSGHTSWTIPTGGLVAVRGSISDRAANKGTTQKQIQILPAQQAVPKPVTPNFSQPIATGPIAATPVKTFSEDSFSQPIGKRTKTPPITAPGLRSIPARDDTDRIRQLPNSYPAWSHKSRPAGRHRVVNTRRFQVGYKIEDVGPSGIGKVELFITENDGIKWYRYGEDADKRSPFLAEVPRDGKFGFALRVRSGVGLASDPPQPGEKPSIVVVVDQTAPKVVLFPIQQGQGTEMNRFQVRWNVTDANPASQAVSLSYSRQPNGPWEPITAWIEDTGSYNWKVSNSAPSKVYVRISARDAAGNVSKAVTQQPLIVDLSKPSARIVDVEASPAATNPF